MGTIVLDFSKGKKYDRFTELIFGHLKKMFPAFSFKTIVEINKGEWEMAKKIELSFEEIVKQNERRVHYYIHKLNVRDPHQKFYRKELVSMWNAYEKHELDNGPLATYFNYTIKNHLIDLNR